MSISKIRVNKSKSKLNNRDSIEETIYWDMQCISYFAYCNEYESICTDELNAAKLMCKSNLLSNFIKELKTDNFKVVFHELLFTPATINKIRFDYGALNNCLNKGYIKVGNIKISNNQCDEFTLMQTLVITAEFTIEETNKENKNGIC